ncbi:MAG: M23 family metallopeptidase [Deltaproteobacteria bacterium]|jgi:murein DD-endopeptidase MepM/ murein hydrolase activator NlpD|nr:M23 family metallopeptidase [Deltaproteobacteria bacterium]MCW9049085.1 M23 family metallopeptidase [Deltaproteobacteria bacterium]
MSVNKDFHPPLNSRGTRKIKSKLRQIVAISALVLIAGVALLLLSSGPSTELEARETPVKVNAPPPPQPVREELRNTVPSGSSITALLGDYFTPQEIHKLNQQSSEIFPFTKISAGQPYRIITLDGQFDSFIYEIDTEEQLVISRTADQVIMERQDIIYDVIVAPVHGLIKTSLFDAIHEINEKPELAYILADIFGWDINFILDLRVGDSFQALVQKRYREGQMAGYGRVLAAEFVNQGQSFKAFRFKDGDQKVSFYNEKGENLRKAFLKAPLSFTRISSGYTMRRLHPITKVWKAHPAIDYAAPVGTPVKTVGDGSITRKGNDRGNGRYLEVTHSNGYKTMYLHLKGFPRGIAKGKRVTQGQVIGYVGSSGLSTGPHLDFRMKRHGKPINPLKLKAPAAKSVSKEHLGEFEVLIAPLVAQLEENRTQFQVAQLQVPHENFQPEKPE